LEDIKERNQVIRYQLMQLGRVVIDLNQERGKSAFFNDYHNNQANKDTQRTHTNNLSLMNKQDCFSIDVRRSTDKFSRYCDLDLDPMTLIYEFNLDIRKMYLLYLHTKKWTFQVKA